MITLRIVRKPKSHKFYRYPNKADTWDNNDINNSLDDLFLLNKGKIIFQAKCQTVANIPGGRYKSSIAPGKFQLRLFSENQNYWPMIHEIIHTSDLEDFGITGKVIPPIKGKRGILDFCRYYVHDWQKFRHSKDSYGHVVPFGTNTRVAWSAGGIVLRDTDLKCFNCILIENKYSPGDLLNGELVEGRGD